MLAARFVRLLFSLKVGALARAATKKYDRLRLSEVPGCDSVERDVTSKEAAMQAKKNRTSSQRIGWPPH
jgi:hypothetical protein